MYSAFDVISRRATCPRVRTGWAAAAVAALTTTTLVGVLACHGPESKTAFESNAARPDVMPTILNKDLPIRYPPALYAEKVQGNVSLRLFVDTNGTVVDDSTRIVESSHVAMLDSAAVQGARDLRFVPAKLRGTPMAISIIFPVYFRHPEAPPPASDTILHKVPLNANGTSDSAAKRSPATGATSGASPSSKSKSNSSH